MTGTTPYVQWGAEGRGGDRRLLVLMPCLLKLLLLLVCVVLFLSCRESCVGEPKK